jgi:hypothetical protein
MTSQSMHPALRYVSHAGIDDYSQAYLPHLDKTSGVHMSINVGAVK